MQKDEQAIRALVDAWMEASKKGDLPTVLKLMADDVVFMVPGREPFGKDAFAGSFKEMKNLRLDATSEIREIKILGDWAWMRNHLKVSVTPPNGKEILRAGYTLTILRKERDEKWVIYRDANLLTAEPSAAS